MILLSLVSELSLSLAFGKLSLFLRMASVRVGGISWTRRVNGDRRDQNASVVQALSTVLPLVAVCLALPHP